METGFVKSNVLSRRAFLGLGASTLMLSGCSGKFAAKSPEPRALAAAELLKQDIFYIAHRGSGDNWTEHTLYAYKQALVHGAQAIELSVHRSLDGHFLCHHDTDLKRLCGVSKTISETPWHEIQALRNNARQWLGPGAALEPIPLLETVLEELADHAVLFIEDKSGQHAAELIEFLRAAEVPMKSIVWKQPAAAHGAELASAAGMHTWGYFAPEMFGEIESLSAGFDAIGIHDSADRNTIERAVSTALPVICWEVHRRSQRDLLVQQGVRGMMCSNLPYVTSQSQVQNAATDGFSSGLRTTGDLPDVLVWKAQPQIDAVEGSLTLDGSRKASYVMGSMKVTGNGDWVVNTKMRWPQLGSENQIAGLAFGLSTDEPYRAFEQSQVEGFHVQLESRGPISLWQAGGKNPQKLGIASWEAPEAGTWVGIELSMAGNRLHIQCGDISYYADLSRTVAPGYVNLLNLIPAGQPVEFSRLSIEVGTSR